MHDPLPSIDVDHLVVHDAAADWNQSREQLLEDTVNSLSLSEPVLHGIAEHPGLALDYPQHGRDHCTRAEGGVRFELDLRFVFTRELTLTGAYLGTRADLDAAVRLIAQGRLAPVVDHIYPLAEFQEAHRRMADRDLFGKFILTA